MSKNDVRLELVDAESGTTITEWDAPAHIPSAGDSIGYDGEFWDLEMVTYYPDREDNGVVEAAGRLAGEYHPPEES